MHYLLRLLRKFLRPRPQARTVLFEPLEGRRVPSAAPPVTIDSVSITIPVSGPITSDSILQITAHNVLGRSDTVAAAVFFLDTNNNGIIDSHDRVVAEASRTGGTNDFTGRIKVSKLPLGNDTILVRAVTSKGGFSTLQGAANNTINVTVVPGPSIDKLALNSISEPKATSKITLQASGVRAGDTSVTSKITGVNFYLDTNDDGIIDAGDTLLGTGTKSGSTWTLRDVILPANTDLTHSIQFLAQATDASARTSAPVSVIAGPQMKEFLAGPSNTITSALTTLTLSAVGVQTPDSRVASVTFWEDTNHDGLFESGIDTLLGTGKKNSNSGVYNLKIDLATTPLPGATGFFAQVADKKSVVSLTYFVPVTDARTNDIATDQGSDGVQISSGDPISIAIDTPDTLSTL